MTFIIDNRHHQRRDESLLTDRSKGILDTEPPAAALAGIPLRALPMVALGLPAEQPIISTFSVSRTAYACSFHWVGC